MTALPPSTDYTGVVTQGQKKAFMTALRGYLSGLLGEAGDKPYVDQIAEKTPGAGVTIDGVLLKDGLVGPGFGGLGTALALNASKYGQNLQVNAAGTAFELAGPPLGHRNAVINGGFDIWQRGSSFAASASGAVYTADRWKFNRATLATGATVSRIADPETGKKYGLRVQRDNGNSSTQNIIMNTVLESRDSMPFAGKRAAISIRGRKGANFSGGAVLQVISGTGTDETDPGLFSGASTLATLQLDAIFTNAFSDATASFDVPTGCTQFALRYIHTPAGVAGAADNIDIIDVQLELGPARTPYERRPLGSELLLCQRYYEKTYNQSVAPASISVLGAVGNAFALGADTNGYFGQVINWRVQKRVTPVLSIWDLAGNIGKVSTHNQGGAATDNVAYTAIIYAGENGFQLYKFPAGNICGIEFHCAADAEL